MTQDNAINILRRFGPRKIEQKLLQLADIFLDPSNVRFRHLGRPVTDKEAEETLWREKDSKTLYQEILVAGGLSEPIYVRRDGKRFVVKEGNRRVTCLRHGKREAAAGRLHGLNTTVFDFVPAFILDDEVTAEEGNPRGPMACHGRRQETVACVQPERSHLGDAPLTWNASGEDI